MELLIIGLIIYVVISVIGEVAKRGTQQTPPPRGEGRPAVPAPSRPQPSSPQPMTIQDLLRQALEEAQPDRDREVTPRREPAMSSGADEETDYHMASEMDHRSMEGEWAHEAPEYESAEGESIEGIGSTADTGAWEGDGLRALEECDEWSMIESARTENRPGELGEREFSRPLASLRQQDLISGVILSQVLERRNRRGASGRRRI